VEKVRAIALLSGGLDSTLSAKIVMKEGIEVIGVHFYTGFSVIERKRLLGCFKETIFSKTIQQLQIPLEIIDISEGYLDVVLNPKYGYGANANPCLDCKIYMFKKAKELLEEFNAKFIVTGEVLGQRPMSQQRHQLMIIEKETGLKGLILRPLSQKLLPETIPEKEGWVKRENLYDIRGRSRKVQMKLAEELGIKEYPQPAGGCCFLTEETYGRRFFDYLKYNAKERFTRKEAMLLAFGRHFRISEKTKAIVGRNEKENRVLQQLSEGKMMCYPKDMKGPVMLLDQSADDDELKKACGILARYCKKGEEKVLIKVLSKEGEKEILIEPLEDKEIETMRI
jgi:tRNA U34 2-thiouridine synthase MnmA/TrmU